MASPSEWECTVDPSRYNEEMYASSIDQNMVRKMKEAYMSMNEQMYAPKFKQEYTKEKARKTMYTPREFKELDLADDELLLRKHGLRDSEDNWTEKAVSILDAMLLDERRAELVKKCEAVDAMAKKRENR